MYGTCKKCGCTDKKACVHPDFGNCWWVDHTHELCSHCDANFPENIREINMLTDALIEDFDQETQHEPLCASDHEPESKLSLLLKD